MKLRHTNLLRLLGGFATLVSSTSFASEKHCCVCIGEIPGVTPDVTCHTFEESAHLAWSECNAICEAEGSNYGGYYYNGSVLELAEYETCGSAFPSICVDPI